MLPESTHPRPELSEAKRRLLEQRLRGKAPAAPGRGGGTIPPRAAASGPSPLSFAQQRLWFLHRLDPESPAYNLPKVIQVEGTLDKRRLAGVLAEIVRRHEILRTTFVEWEGQPAQRVGPPVPVPLPEIDLRALPETERQTCLRRLAAEEGKAPFDLSRGPVLRVRIVTLGTGRHVLLFTLHHIVSDGWSTGVLIRELGVLYRAYASGDSSPLPELPIQYADFAEWERHRLRGETLRAKLAYWRARLDGIPALALPTDRPRSADTGTRGDRLPFELPAGLSERLRALAREEGATVFMLLLAAYKALLHRYSDQEDVCVGVPVAGRGRMEVEPLIGFFVNTLALRTHLSGGPGFRGLLSRVRETVLSAQDHQDLPFEKLVEELAPERRLDVTPLFQVMFSLLGSHGEAVELPGARLSPLEVESRTAKFDLTLAMIERGGRFAGSLEYRTGLYDAATIGQLRDHWAALLSGIVAAPDAGLAELPLLGEEESRQVLRGAAVAAGAAWTGLHEPFEAQAARSPESLAVVAGDRELTYAALDREASALAARLRRLGVGPESPVAACLERSADLAVGLLGVLKSGGAYVPLDPALPRERLAFLLEDSRAVALVTHPSLAERWSGGDVPLLVLSGGGSADRDEAGESQATPPESLAYVIYTSGSTGRPKGVGVAHAAAAAHCRAAVEAYGLGPADRVLQFASASFDVSLEQMIPALAVGATLVLRGEEVLAPRELSSWMAARGVTVANLPTAVWHRWVQDAEALAAAPRSLRLVIAGGEEMPGAAVRLWERSLLQGTRLLNAYGPTEAVVTATLHEPRDGERARVPIGSLLPGRSARIADRKGHATPRVVPGELLLGGLLARGYLGRPGLTAERFVPDPFGEPGSRVYRTGDLARRLPSGALELWGRVDHQVKIRGFRIELGEIEALLGGHPAVREAVVTVLDGGPGGPRLAAYVAADGLSAGELRSWLRDRLPEPMVPAAYLFLPSLPLSATGKVDRRALPPLSMEGAGAPEDRMPRAPWSQALGAERAVLEPGFCESAGGTANPVEEMLAAIWSEALGAQRIGSDAEFFALGGHSLLAAQVVSRIRETLGVELPLRRFFEIPRLGEQAAEIERTLRGGMEPAPPIIPTSRETALPLSFAQQRLWFLDQLEPGGSAYNITSALRLRGHLKVAALQRGFDEIIRRHEALRTTFEPTVNGPRQRIAAPEPRAFRHVDLTSIPAGEREREVRRLLAETSARPFDLRRGPVFEALLLRAASDEHILCVRMHHIVSDAWSRGILVSELATLYSSFSRELPSPLPELPVQYGDFAQWQQHWLSGEENAHHLAYWRDRLADLPPTLELLTDHPRSARPSRGDRVPVALPAPLSEALTALARREGATLFMVLLAAFQTLLRRYSGQDDFGVGTPVAGRTRREIEGLIGFFVNTLVLRASLADNPAFQALLRRTRETALGAFAHQDLPFEKLVEELAPDRRLHRMPLFQVVLSLQMEPAAAMALPDLELQPVEVENRTAKFDLTLALGARAGRVSGWLEYPSDAFERTTVRRLASHLENLLAASVADPSPRLSELPLLSAAERGQVLVEWNATASGYPREACIHQLFADQARRTPEAVAVVSGRAVLTYRELAERSNRLARRLRRAGVGPEVPVGLCLRRSADLIVAILATLKAGGLYVPLDPDLPRERLSFLLEDTGVAVLLTEERAAPAPPGTGALLLSLERALAEAAGESPEGFDGGAGAANLAYVIYTSGSTGRPNGVAVPHRGVVRLVRETGYADFGADQVFCQLAPVSFDASTLEIWGPLLNGGRLVVPPPESLSLQDLGEALERWEVTTLWLTAGLFHQMVDDQLPRLARLRQLLAGGDVLAVPQVRRVLELAPGCRVINGYGPTESTTFTCCHPMSRPEQVGHTVPIGRPIANTEVFLLGRHLEPVPPGAVGEIYVAGDGLARGYWRRPGLTAERFVPHPWSRVPGERLYRTGDLARHLPDGRIEFLGRRDHQVKLRGFRIELGEVEAAMVRHPDLTEAVAVVREDGGDKRLVCYAVPRPGRTVAPAELRAFLRERLPEPQVPSAVVVLESLPLTRNGKVDRRALGPPEAFQTPSGDAPLPPRTPVERSLAAVWAELLGRQDIGLRDDFFEAGGHSLLATRVLSRVSHLFAVDVPLRQFFEEPTLEALARAVEALRPHSREAIQAGPPGGPAPLSFSQQRLWFLDQLEPGSAAYNIPVAVRLRGRLDPEALRRALGEIVCRHEVLRTGFQVIDGEPAQVAVPCPPLPLPLVGLDGLPPDRREPEARRRIDAEALIPFALAAPPLIRARLLRLAGDDHVLTVTIHHIASDGWSMSVLVRELTVLYTSFSRGEPSPLPELPIQYADFARWQRRRLRGEALETEIAHWAERLRGAPNLELPTDRPRPAVAGAEGATRSFALGPSLSEGLLGWARQEGATPFVLLLAAFQALLHSHSGQDDLTVGTPVAGRRRVEVEELIGFFVNTLVLRTGLGGDPLFCELLARAREITLEAQTHQDLPFERLVEILEPQRHLDRAPLFQVMLALQNAPRERLELPGVELSPFRVEGRTAKFDLTLAMIEGPRGLSGTLEYRTDLFDPATAERMLARFTRLLEGVAADPSLRLSELPLLSAAERSQVLIEWNDTGASTEWMPVHGSFGLRAARRPEATALVWNERRLSYGELAGKAWRLARRLRHLGVGPDVPVGLCMGRSADLIVAILGILEAGGAYVPLDPGYPRERLARMLEDVRPPVIVADALSAPALPEHGAALIPPEAEEPEGAEPAEGAARVGPENLSHVIFTSGSTGRPKGVMIRHAGTSALARWAAAVLSPEELDGVLASTSINFDVSVFEILATLALGGKVILAQDALHLPTLPASGEVRWLSTVPSAASELVRSGGIPASVRAIGLGGEPLPGSLAQRLHRQTRAAAVWNLYGPSEDTTYSTWARVPPGSGEPAIGRPLSGTRAYLLDRQLRPVPLGVPGELYLAGEGLARGYASRPDLTAERFVPNPLGERPGERLYRTGDRVRALADGRLDFLGRIDHQVKIRGFRVELPEIEAALADHPAVSEAVVVVRGEDENRRLAAFFVPAGRPAPAPGALRAALAERLPGHMVPSRFVALEALPRNPNGKIDRGALPADLEDVRQDPGEAPGSWTQELIAGLWAEVLGCPTPGPGDSFFDLGGHSLLATRVVSRLRESFGVEAPVRLLFEAPTLAELTHEIEKRMQAGPGRQAPPIRPAGRPGPAPLSFSQLRLWFLQRLEPESPAYNMPGGTRLTGPLDVPALAAALGEVVRRHEILRTSFEELDGEPVQRIAPAAPPALPLVDLGVLPAAAREATVRELLAGEARAPFRLDTGPLLRLALLRLGPAEHVLLLSMHHIASDGWSMGILLREVTTFYAALAAGDAPRLPEPPVQYSDFAVWQREWLRGEVLAGEIAYWREQLAGAPPFLALPADRPHPPTPGSRGASLPVALPPPLAAALSRLSRGRGATLFMTLLAAFQVLLSRWAGQEDVSVGVPVAGRNRLETEGLIGCFVNTLVLRSRPSGDLSFAALLVRVRETALGAHQHQDLPFEKLVEELQPQRSLGRTPLFQAMLALQNLSRPVRETSGDLRLSSLSPETRTAKFEISLTLAESGEGIHGSLEYGVDLFDRPTILRMLGHFAALLGRIAATPERPLEALPHLTDAELHQALAEWAPGPAERAAEAGIPGLFSLRASRTPEAPAVELGGERLSYGALELLANRIARRLRRLGVGPEVVVAVSAHRAPETIAALLGVLKAGGAYLPLDPQYPRERLALLIEEARPRLLLAAPGMEDLARPWMEVLRLAELAGETAGESGAPLASPVLPEALAYVLYTSGSTGRPKGVMVSHGSLAGYVDGAGERFALGPGDRVLQFASLGFDTSAEEIYPTLTRGATLVLRDHAMLASAAVFFREVERLGITVLDLPTAYWHELAAELDGGVRIPASLRLVVLGGEKALAPRLAEWRAHAGSRVRLVNTYGPTETTIVATGCELAGPSAVAGPEEAPIGRAVERAAAYVLDGSLQPVPAGHDGELYLTGAGLARGYLGRPDLTAERFLPHPFSGGPGERLYRTGDRVRFRPDGLLEFRGRADSQVKIRGFRVELEEIEAALRRHPSVREAAVVAREQVSGLRLAAYLTCPGEPAVPAELTAFLRRTLPEHMLPSVFIPLPALPLTPSGKLDRRALPDLETPPPPPAGSLPPRDLVELELTAIWEELLETAPVGIRDDFFALGGHSLLAVRLMGRIHRRLGLELPLAVLFQSPTIEALAARIRGGRPDSQPPLLVTLQPEGPGLPLFLVHPVGGNVFCYLDLVRRLGRRRPVHALQAGPGEENLERMAARYVRELRAVQPVGPYQLAGWSFGGVAAFEMARQLRAEGQAVSLLALIDSELPSGPRGGVAGMDETALLLLLAEDLEGLSGRRLGVTRADLLGLSPEAALDLVLERALAAGALPADAGAAALRRLARVFRANLRRLLEYRPEAYPGSLLLLRAEESLGRAAESPWQALARGGLETHVVPGDHYTSLREPRARHLAALLAARLDRNPA